MPNRSQSRPQIRIQPRLKSSVKWTALPPELLTQIQGVCRENFAEKSKKGQFLASGQLYSEEILFQLGYLENARLRQINFNVSIQFDPKKENALKLIHLALDCAGSLMATHFEEDLPEVPSTWEEIVVEGKKVFHCLTTENSQLEAEADRLLGVESDDLVQDAEFDLTDDEDEDETPPQLLKKKPGKSDLH